MLEIKFIILHGLWSLRGPYLNLYLIIETNSHKKLNPSRNLSFFTCKVGTLISTMCCFSLREKNRLFSCPIRICVQKTAPYLLHTSIYVCTYERKVEAPKP